MRKTIWKFIIDIQDEQTLIIPGFEEALSFGRQHPKTGSRAVSMWGIVDPDGPNKKVTVSIRGTGHALSGNEGKFISTIILTELGLVFHCFVKVEGETNE